MKPRNTLIAVAVLALVGLYAYFVELKGGAKKQALKEAEARLWEVTPEEVTRFTIFKGDVAITVERGETGWNILAPIETRADSFSPDDVARAIAELRRETVVDEAPDDLDAFGLADPELRVHWSGPEGLGEVEIGIKNPVGETRYARVAGETPVFLLDAFAVSGLDRDLYSLRDKKLLDFEVDDVTELRMENQGPGHHPGPRAGPVAHPVSLQGHTPRGGSQEPPGDPAVPRKPPSSSSRPARASRSSAWTHPSPG